MSIQKKKKHVEVWYLTIQGYMSSQFDYLCFCMKSVTSTGWHCATDIPIAGG